MGRDQSVDVLLHAPTASRVHARVFHNEAGDVFLQDLGSRYGTFSNNEPLLANKVYKWTEGMCIRFGADDAHFVSETAGLEVIPGRSGQRSVAIADATATQSAPSSSRPLLCSSTQHQPPAQPQQSLLQARSRPAEQPLLLPRSRPRNQSQPACTSQDRDAEQQVSKRPRLANHEIDAGPAASAEKSQMPPILQATTSVPPILQGAGSTRAKTTCDKCDGVHVTQLCPHFKGGRDRHKDAWLNYGKKHPRTLGSDGGNYVLLGSKAKRVPQPGDGSCLFHSLCYVYGKENMAEQLRRSIADFIAKHPQLEIAGDTLEEWVRWDQNTTCEAYASQMARSGWGGGIELAACSHLLRVNVHVYEQQSTGHFLRISCFDHPAAQRTLNILYKGRMHYDALVVVQAR